MLLDIYHEQSATHVAKERIRQAREETKNIILSSYGEERNCSMTDPFSTKELKDALKKVKTRQDPGPDGIKGEMLNHLGACFRAVFLKIFNLLAVTSSVPKKDKDKVNPCSYSLLSCVGKLLDRMVNRPLFNHLENNNVLSLTQTGHKKFRSIEDKLAYLAQKSAFVKEYPMAMFCPQHCSWSTLTTLLPP